MPSFLDEITTNETFFDRDPHQYNWFARDFLDELARERRRGAGPAGSASGRRRAAPARRSTR
ncbi:MAG: hypothetical protein U0800_11075 [Isosphaeraceae bacterium]